MCQNYLHYKQMHYNFGCPLKGLTYTSFNKKAYVILSKPKHCSALLPALGDGGKRIKTSRFSSVT